MAYDPNTRTFTVGTDDELNAAIANIDAIGKTGNNNGLGAGAYTIRFNSDIKLDGTTAATYAAQNTDGTTGNALTINSGNTTATVQGSSQLYALNLTSGTTVTIDGGGNTLDGDGTYNGFFVYNGTVAIQNLTIANTVAQGGNSGFGGGGAGLGGGLFVAGRNATEAFGNDFTDGGNVSLTNVSFNSNAATGGSAGIGISYGGGGLLAGDGRNDSGNSSPRDAGGGVGNQFGGLILGAAPGQNYRGIAGGSFGGAGGSGADGDGGGGGGVGGKYGYGGFGGGAGAGAPALTATGGFGGGGGGGSYYASGGGFGGGGSSGNNQSGRGGGGFGAGSDVGSGGGGGLGAGANVFVQEGGILNIGGSGTLGAGTVMGGAGRGSSGVSGAGLGSGIFIQGDQSITLAPGAGQTLTVNGVIADQSGSLAQLTPGQGTGAGAGSLTIGEGTVVLAPVDAPTSGAATANTFTGGTALNSGATLNLVSTGAAGSGAISFNSMSGSASAQLVLEQSAQVTNGTFTNTLNDFGDNEALVLRDFAFSGTESYTVSNGVLTVQNAGGQSQSFTLTNTNEPAETTYFARSDGQGGTIISSDLVCYAAGTRIRTMSGEVAVEALRVGDFVVTGSGAMRPIRWIGHRTVECRRHPQASLVMPVRIAAGAFGPGKPARDLTVSPAHAICVEIDGGEVLMPAVRLLNGTTVARVEVESVTYWHVELDSHDILLAEGLPAESYLDCGNRSFFANAAVTGLWAVPDELPDGALPFCRPFHEEGSVVEAARAQLEKQALALGWRLDAAPCTDLHLVVDGRVIAPEIDSLNATFALPASARDVRLVSSTSAPAHVVSGSADDRRLGVSIRRLVLDDGVTGAREIALNDSRLSHGFYPVDRDAGGTQWRWTNGAAILPSSLWQSCRGTIRVQLVLAGSVLPRWVSPTPKADVVATGGFRQRA